LVFHLFTRCGINILGYISYLKSKKFDKITLLIESSEGNRL
jgi:hypothetical protein